MLDTLKSLLAFTGLALSAWGLGRPLLRCLRIVRADRLDGIVWSFALGLVVAGLALTLWGLVGGLDAFAIRCATVITAGFGCAEIVGELRADRVRGRRRARRIPAPNAPPIRAIAAVMSALCFLAAGGSLVSALAPAVAGDALCYHLELPKVFLAYGSIEYLPLHENSTFPLLTEIWYLWALALDSAVTAQLVHWGLGVLLAGASVLLARPVLGHVAAWMAGAIALMVPGITNQMAAPLNDVALAAFTTLALVAWQVGRTANPADRWRWFVVAGVMGGAALSIKYVAILFAAAVGASWCWSFARRASQRWLLLRGAAIVASVAMLASGVWYVRAAYHRGNPVYPFLPRLVGGETPPPTQGSKTPLKWTAWDVFSSPWQATIQPERFGGRGHQLGGLFLIALPAVLLVKNRSLRALLGIAAIYAVLWYALRQNVRFLLPIVPILASAAAAVLIDLRGWPAIPRTVAGLSCTAVIALGAMIPLHRARAHLAVVLGRESRDAFLARSEPTYRAAQFVNEQLPHRSRILSEDFRGFYFQAEFIRENAFRRATNYAQQMAVPENLVPTLRAAGFTLLLLAEAKGPTAPNNGTLSRRVDADQAIEPGRLATLLEYDFQETDGVMRHYRLVELRGDAPTRPRLPDHTARTPARMQRPQTR